MRSNYYKWCEKDHGHGVRFEFGKITEVRCSCGRLIIRSDIPQRICPKCGSNNDISMLLAIRRIYRSINKRTHWNNYAERRRITGKRTMRNLKRKLASELRLHRAFVKDQHQYGERRSSLNRFLDDLHFRLRNPS